MDLWSIQRKSFALLDKSAKRKYLFAVCIQMSLSLFDIFGIALSGVIGVLTASTFTQTQVPPIIRESLSILGVAEQNPGDLILVLCLVTLLFFVVKAILALLFSRKCFKFLAHQQSRITSLLLSRTLNSEYIWLRHQEPNQLSTSIILGVSAATTNSLGQFMLMTSEVFLIIFFIIILVFVSPLVAIFTLLYLTGVIILLKQIVGKKVTSFNRSLADIQIESQIYLSSVIKLIREIRVFRRIEFFEYRFGKFSEERALFFAQDMWIQQVPKYVLEISMLVGATAMLFVGNLISNPENIIPVLTIYLTAAGRIFPSLIRVQGAVFSLQSRQHYASMAHELLIDLELAEVNSLHFEPQISKKHAEKIPEDSYQFKCNLKKLELPTIELRQVFYRFPNSGKEVVKNHNFLIKPGEKVAIVGPSGAGKSTLCDLLLGLLNPTHGQILIGGESAAAWVAENPGKISYLPQNIALTNGTLLDNVCLGIERSEIDWDLLNKTLIRAQLKELVEELPEGIDSKVGAGGTILSGGQRQRVGFARALYSKPQILIMDEATSALDAETEAEVVNALDSLDNNVTVITIAHRLSSIRKIPRIIYLEQGKILGDGDLNKIRKEIPSFDNQLLLFGI